MEIPELEIKITPVSCQIGAVLEQKHVIALKVECTAQTLDSSSYYIFGAHSSDPSLVKWIKSTEDFLEVGGSVNFKDMLLHNHDDRYASANHTHTLADITDIEIDEEHTHVSSDITDAITLVKNIDSSSLVTGSVVKQYVDSYSGTQTVPHQTFAPAIGGTSTVYLTLCDREINAFFKGMVRLNEYHCVVDIAFASIEEGAVGYIYPTEINELNITLSIVECEGYLALKVDRNSNITLRADVLGGQSSHPSVVAWRESGESSITFKNLSMSRICGWEKAERRSGWAYENLTVPLAYIRSDELVRPFNVKTSVTYTDNSKLMGEATVIGSTYKGEVTFVKCDFNYTDDKNDLVFKVGTQNDSLILYPSFTDENKNITIESSGYSQRSQSESTGVSGFQEIDVSNIDFGSKIYALGSSVSDLESRFGKYSILTSYSSDMIFNEYNLEQTTAFKVEYLSDSDHNVVNRLYINSTDVIMRDGSHVIDEEGYDVGGFMAYVIKDESKNRTYVIFKPIDPIPTGSGTSFRLPIYYLEIDGVRYDHQIVEGYFHKLSDKLDQCLMTSQVMHQQIENHTHTVADITDLEVDSSEDLLPKRNYEVTVEFGDIEYVSSTRFDYEIDGTNIVFTLKDQYNSTDFRTSWYKDGMTILSYSHMGYGSSSGSVNTYDDQRVNVISIENKTLKFSYNFNGLISVRLREYKTGNGEVFYNINSTVEGTSPLIEAIYPVGSIYMTTKEDFDPQKAFGGIWEQIYDIPINSPETYVYQRIA